MSVKKFFTNSHDSQGVALGWFRVEYLIIHYVDETSDFLFRLKFVKTFIESLQLEKLFKLL